MLKNLIKKIAVLLPLAALFIISSPAEAQVRQPVQWSVTSTKVKKNLYEIKATGEIKRRGWHIYDLQEYEMGPNSTIFTVSGEGIEPVGEPQITSEVKRSFDEIFEMEIGTCDGPVTITQQVNVIKDGTSDVAVHIEWQACNDSNCLPVDEFDETVQVVGKGTASSGSISAASGASGSAGSLWALILEAILWGFAMLLTPCVFPMVPMTVSFFMKGSSTKAEGRFKASMYGLFIVLLYTVPISLIILLTRIIGGDAVTADIFNWLATHWLPNLIFFTVFMIFAASFFGAFEITLPSSLVNKSDAKSSKSGLAGIFFMALTLVLVSFSCTGPIVGSVLIKSTQGEFWSPMVTMLAFSVAFALPFTVLALFPSLLKNLPKSGGWLNSVKVVLGFIEIALGFKFLSTADQTYHWGLLDREIYLAIWIVTFSLLGMYLLGKLQFKNDDKVEKLSVGRLALAIGVFTFVVYMIPGMWGAPLKGISGYLPPITTQDFVLGQTSYQPTTYVIDHGTSSTDDDPVPTGRKYSDFLKMPYDIPAFFDYNEAREYALSVGKPLFIDFTGHGCVNCREMEARVWSDPRVLKMLMEDYVVCSLYADDKKEVDEADWVTLDNGKVLKSLGKINSNFAMTRFNVNAQPYYAILDPETEEHKVPSRGYNLDVEAYVNFLTEGLK
ncbi:MAG: thioredoxin family protein [Bacteroidales bacterium]|nr:thioredoxin family protein [Bacteroidales bacterium]